MPEVAYLDLKVDGTQVKGGCLEKDTKGWIEVQGFEHTITIPTHRQTGAATGETMHGPIVLVCPMSRADPLMQKALNLHSKVDGQVDFYRTRDGKRKHWYTIKFTDARLVEIRTFKELAIEGGDKPDMVQYQFRYRKIEWEHKEANQTAEADWLDK